MNKFTILAIGLLASLSFQLAQADDVYNFYFQKADTAKIVQNGKVLEAETDESQSEEKKIGDKATSAPVKVTDPKTAAKLKTSVAIERGDEDRNWTLRLGLGSVSIYGSGDLTIPGQGYQSNYKAYVVGANYHFNRYFDIEGDIMFLDKGREGIYGQPAQIKDFAVWNLGAGVTPIHLNIFGRELLRIGFVAGLMGGSDFKTRGSNNSYSQKELAFYLGPRMDISFSEKLSLQFAVRANTDKYSGFQSGMTLNYDF